MSGFLVDALKVLRERWAFQNLDEALALLHLTELELDIDIPVDLEEALLQGEWAEQSDPYFVGGSDDVAAEDDQYSADSAEQLVSAPRAEKRPGGPAAPSPSIFAANVKVICSIVEPVRQSPRGPVADYHSVPLQTTRNPQQPAPVLDARTLPAALYSLTKAPRRTSEPDLDKVMDRLARLIPLDHVPLRKVPSAPWRLRVLVENRLRTGPCAADVDTIVGTLRSTLGANVVREWGFSDVPGLPCGGGPVWTWLPIDEHVDPSPVLFIVGADASARDDGLASVHVAAHRFSNRGLSASLLIFGEASDARAREYPVWSIRD